MSIRIDINYINSLSSRLDKFSKKGQHTYNCRCPICRKYGFKALQEEFTGRAIHNAWVHQQEVRKTRKLMRENRYDEYVDKIMSKTNFAKLFLASKSLKAQYKN